MLIDYFFFSARGRRESERERERERERESEEEERHTEKEKKVSERKARVNNVLYVSQSVFAFLSTPKISSP